MKIFLYFESERQSNSDSKSCPSSQDEIHFLGEILSERSRGRHVTIFSAQCSLSQSCLAADTVPFMSNNFISKLFTVCPKQLLLALSSVCFLGNRAGQFRHHLRAVEKAIASSVMGKITENKLNILLTRGDAFSSRVHFILIKIENLS